MTSLGALPMYVAVTISPIGTCFSSIGVFLGHLMNGYLHKKLQKEFHHWYKMRQEALKCEDPAKAKLLAKNIDQAKLNKLYYDYFFEGLMNNLATLYLPIFILLAYVNEAYRSSNLSKLFGRDYIKI